MKSKSNGLVSSRKTPRGLVTNTNAVNNLYLHMFMDDVTSGFSYDFGSHNDVFYIVSEQDKFLEKYLSYENYRYLYYNFEEMMMSSLYNLIFWGHSYLEFVLLKDEKGKLKGIEFLPINAKRLLKCFGISLFIGKNYEKKISLFGVPTKHVISYDLKKLGYKRNYFKKRFRKLKKLDITGSTHLTISPDMKNHFDFSVYSNKKALDIVTVFSDIGWIGRDYNNQNMSESYFLYQRAKYLNFKWKMLQYLLNGINDCIKEFESVLNTSGSITVAFPEKDYLALFDQYFNEKITAEELSNELIK